MSTEYDSDDFDMEQVEGVDNPVELGDSYDASSDGNGGAGKVKVPKPYTVKTRFPSVKDGKLVYKVAEQPSNKQRRLSKPFSYKRK